MADYAHKLFYLLLAVILYFFFAIIQVS